MKKPTKKNGCTPELMPKHGDKTIRWTVALDARLKGGLKPKHVKPSGWLYVHPNKWHGIDYENKQRYFRSMDDLRRVFGETLADYGITLKQ
jgi:hypothetical protein